MKRLLLIIFTAIAAQSINGQAIFTKILDKKYSDLPFKLRIENSGVYGISSFDVDNGGIYIKEFDNGAIYGISSGRLQKAAAYDETDKDFICGAGMRKAAAVSDYQSSFAGSTTLKKCFAGGNDEIFKDNGGVLSAKSGDRIQITVKSRSLLNMDIDLNGDGVSFDLHFPSNLAYADLIGIDSNGDIFLLTESYVNEIPLKVKREVYTLSNDGKVLSVLEVPSIKYMFTVRDFQIDAAGNLYQMICSADGISIIKWSGLTEYSAEKVIYPPEYNYELNYNSITPVNEPAEVMRKTGSIQSVSRTAALRIAESYTLYKYSCTSKNLAPNTVKGPDNDLVQTPEWLITGKNARIPYMWGGFSTLAQFSSGLQNGKYAGDINTEGVSGYAVGVDCSGFVSRCWQLSYHSSTSMMPSITTQYASWDDLKPGDAIHKVGHVRLFVDKAPNGALRVIESSARDWDVSYWTYPPSDLTLYTPRYYTGMVNDYTFNQPLLTSVINGQGFKTITWECDTAGVKGYRVYRSFDGTNWGMIKNESEITETSAVDSTDAPAYYRVSSVADNPPAYSESNWSNVLGAGNPGSSKKILVVDGFNRQTGDWRGNGSTFADLYGQALAGLNLTFESVKNKNVIDGTVNLNDYDAVFWMLGDESTADETFSQSEQTLVKNYLESGGNLFVSGSEIGWDLSYKGSSSDKDFYANYLKAVFVSDNSLSNAAAGSVGTALAGTNFHFGQTYEIGYPDEIGTNGGSTICMNYANGKGAGIEYSGQFGTSSKTAKLIYLGFPPETTADDSSFDSVISKAVEYFFPGITSIAANETAPVSFSLEQNYPNPFNPSTTIKYSVPAAGRVTLKLYDVLGRETATLVNETKSAGNYSIRFDGSGLPSGIYIYRLEAGKLSLSKKMIIIK